MYLVAIAWMYVVLMMTVAEAMSPQGTVIGAVITFLLYGVLPLALLLYILGTPGRRRARLQAEAAEAASLAGSGAAAPDGGGEPAGAAVAAEREKP
ncbi:hypothetical protein ACPOLB_03560 [Rubrivivax sp. RP6-9]|uniref:hypothetical protein n=1 Tax=Rubrivivax sp. RP6-9 TaxID=3415750 RepID=UPI003CC68312